MRTGGSQGLSGRMLAFAFGRCFAKFPLSGLLLPSTKQLLRRFGCHSGKPALRKASSKRAFCSPCQGVNLAIVLTRNSGATKST